MNFSHEEQEKFIRLAMEQAEQSITLGCPSFGLVLVSPTGEVLGAAHSTASPETDMTCHAEINLIRQLAKKFGNVRLTGCAAFINAASCAMCACALVQASVRDFYYGASPEPDIDPAFSYEELAKYSREPLNIHEGILADECRAQIQRGRENRPRRMTKTLLEVVAEGKYGN